MAHALGVNFCSHTWSKVWMELIHSSNVCILQRSIWMHTQNSFKYIYYRMNTRILLLFLVGCMGVRLLLTYLAKVANPKWLRVMGYVAILPTVGFMYLFLSGTRNNTGAFGEKIWWNYLRPVHSLLYGLFAYAAITGNRNAWIFLLVDALIGLGGFSWEHWSRIV